MPKAVRKSISVENTSENEVQDDSNLSQESSIEEEVVLQSPQFKPKSQMQAMQQMYMPYVKGSKWTGLWMTACITDSWNGKLNVKIYLNVNWQCYHKQENARKCWPGQMILELTSMCPGACPKKIYA